MPEILKTIADNPALIQALRDVLEAEFSLDEVVTTMSNEKMGEVIRARVEGLKKIERAFRKIESLKTVPERERGANPAR